MIRLFSTNQTIAFFLIPVFVLIHLILGYYFPTLGTTLSGQDNLWDLDFSKLPEVYSQILVFLFICCNAFLINFVFNSLEFHGKMTFLPSIFYLFVLFLFPNSLRMGEEFISQFFFVLAFYQLLNIRQNDDARNHAFLSGLFLGISTTFTPVNFVFLFLLLIGILIIRPFVLREITLPFVGFLLPFPWVFVVNPDFLNDFFVFNAQIDLSDYNRFAIFIPIVFLTMLVVLSLKNLIKQRIKSTIRFKRITLLTLLSLFVFLLFGIFMMTVYDSYSYFILVVAVLPFVLPFAYLKPRKKSFFNSFFYGLIIINILKFFIHDLL